MDISTCLRPPMFISLVPPGVVSTLCAPMFRRKYTTDPWTDLLDEVRVHESNLSSIKQLVMSLGPKSDASIASAELRCWDLAWAAWRESYNTLLAEEKAMRPPKPPCESSRPCEEMQEIRLHVVACGMEREFCRAKIASCSGASDMRFTFRMF